MQISVAPELESNSAFRWLPIRDTGLAQLHAFLPRAGKRYAQSRNYDNGPDDRSNVSVLSPWIRHRLVREDEVVSAVLARHSFSSAEKFIQEVVWRTYWKGWLEMRPSVWQGYRDAVTRSLRALDHDRDVRARWKSAVSGQTGITCFDAWAHELVDVGYLHNHARMWFASIWIFTLRLPWELGADFFLRHLLDGDPATNTLSWRWVAGLQTRGKTYLARSENIAKYTNGRFATTTGLARVAPPPEVADQPQTRPLPISEHVDETMPSGLLVTEDDGHPESLPLAKTTFNSVAGIVCTTRRSPLGAGKLALDFAQGAVGDGVARAADMMKCPGLLVSDANDLSEIEDWARSQNLRQIVTGHAPVGPVRETLDRLENHLSTHEIRLVRVQRLWDQTLWPHAKHGFFPFKEKVPAALKQLGVM